MRVRGLGLKSDFFGVSPRWICREAVRSKKAARYDDEARHST